MNKHPFDRTQHVIVRRPGPNLAEGISHGIGTPDFDRALLQHRLLCEALEQCGVKVSVLKADRDFPDGCFLNDVAVVTETLSVMTNFSDASPRQGEQKMVANLLAPIRFMKFISAPGTVDAADVLCIENHYYIGLSSHTNSEGANQLAVFLKEYGKEVTILDLRDMPELHLKNAVCFIGRDRILIREEIARHFAFMEYEKIIVPKHESHATSSVMINGTLLMPAGYPETRRQVKLLNMPVVEVTITEFEKMNGSIGSLLLPLPTGAEVNVVPLPTRETVAA